MERSEQPHDDLQDQESEKKRKYVEDLQELTEDQKEILKAKVEKHKGLVRIFIHPYYSEQQQTNEHLYEGNRVTIVEQGLERLLAANKLPPTILFEPQKHVHSTIEKLAPILERSGNNIYLVKTNDHTPTPYTPNETAEEEFHSWQKLIAILKELGIKKCLIGGMYLWAMEINATNLNRLQGCVGAATSVLKSDFEIEISNLAHPSSRKNLIRPYSFPEEYS
jgi:hypothetical protein